MGGDSKCSANMRAWQTRHGFIETMRSFGTTCSTCSKTHKGCPAAFVAGRLRSGPAAACSATSAEYSRDFRRAGARSVAPGRDRRPCARHVVLVRKRVGLAKLRAIDVLNLVPRNAKQPSDDRRLSGEGREFLKRHEKDVLDDVLDEVGARREPTRDVRVDSVRVPTDEFGGGLSILRQNGGEQRLLLGRGV